jgi:hypothetical protein
LRLHSLFFRFAHARQILLEIKQIYNGFDIFLVTRPPIRDYFFFERRALRRRKSQIERLFHQIHVAFDHRGGQRRIAVG